MLQITLSGANGRVNQLITQAVIQEFNEIYTISHAITSKGVTDQFKQKSGLYSMEDVLKL